MKIIFSHGEIFEFHNSSFAYLDTFKCKWQGYSVTQAFYGSSQIWLQIKYESKQIEASFYILYIYGWNL